MIFVDVIRIKRYKTSRLGAESRFLFLGTLHISRRNLTYVASLPEENVILTSLSLLLAVLYVYAHHRARTAERLICRPTCSGMSNVIVIILGRSCPVTDAFRYRERSNPRSIAQVLAGLDYELVLNAYFCTV